MIAREDCAALDARDAIAHARERFDLPEGTLYLDGNSLGALPKTVAARVREAVEKEWGRGLIRSWNEAGWYRAPQRIGAKIARLIGAADDEVIVADSTSVDLYKVLIAALRLRPGRTSILGAEGDFPTDAYIAASAAELTGKRFVRVPTERLTDAIALDTAVVMLTHANYKSGQLHDLTAITKAAHAKGALIVWDLSHTAGNMPIGLSAAGADFAVGCGYKYLNGGPGAPAYAFVAKRHQEAFRNPLTGWLGHADPFAFADDFAPAQGMDKLLTGTPPILSLVALEAALDAFEGLDMRDVRAKCESLTSLFVALTDERLTRHGFALASPRITKDRGAQVALAHAQGYAIMQALIARGLIGDFREPDIVRFGFAPLYTRHTDVFDAACLIDEVMTAAAWDTPDYRSRKPVT